MKHALRWEVCRLFEPWAAPNAALLGPPIATGTVTRDDDNASPPADAFFAPSDPIAIPAGLDGERSLILVCEVHGPRGWVITIGAPAAPPAASDGLNPPIDLHPCIFIPPSGMQGSGRSREVRAVRPGSSFIAQPVRS
ncbi:hypothetical protein Q8W71_06845 [Methylobacterium sp. NEAU 140]|uniref:hypothetical protein n=1 Tax=Methylobacterium sp. NEAU 140 TaxID=3064945 RepID=UPI002733AA0C|nr:hypothetical protein [Methylobacterium sp. NEAU 140]MDP4022334.1 hypothetical protein [Methylobacterium sp. NEAU 140]